MPWTRALLGLLVALPALAEDLNPAQREWLAGHALAFAAVEAGHGFEDLQRLKKMIGDARIVSLGESTHGSREIFQMKHRLVEFLASEMGFSIFSIEASMPEAYRVNEYVLRGEGDPKTLIRGMYFWTWTTEEVLAMVEWMREFNASGRGRIEFTGFDMQTPDVAARIVKDFVRRFDPEQLDGVAASYAKVVAARRGAGAPFGTATGSFPVAAAAGKSLRFSGHIRTEGVVGYAGLWWRADKGRQSVAFGHMADRGPKGTTPWTRYEIKLAIPADITNINFGVLLSGSGKAWFDGLEVELDGRKFQSAAFDLDFEGARIRGLRPPSGAYHSGLDREAPCSGQQSLRLERAAPLARPGIEPREAARLAGQVLERMESGREGYLKQAQPAEVDWAIQNARVVLQCMQSRAGQISRDRSMAANVQWIAQQNPEARIILWAHNGHVARNPGWMGSFLHQAFGAAHLPVGFATRTGTYTARGKGGGPLASHDLQAPPPGSVEALLAQTGEPRLILDLRRVAPGSPGSGWLAEPRPMRSLGALAQDVQFFPHQLTRAFDLLIYIEQTSAAVQMR
ncbi:MAG: erythromycin esterase family protein [Planctomycetota bacterium]|jgi:erythromycin esterase-like protein